MNSTLLSRKRRLNLEHLEDRLAPSVNPTAASPNYSPINVAVARVTTSNNTITIFNGANAPYVFGQSNDLIAYGDLNGDGITDIATFNAGTWNVDINRDGATDRTYTFGQAGDIPMIGDVDGDGYGDLTLYRPSTGQWLVDPDASAAGATSPAISTIGNVSLPANDVIPMAADVNGDGRLDRILYQPSTGNFYVDLGFSGTAFEYPTPFGGPVAGAIPFVANLTDSGATDLGIAINGVWYYRSINLSTSGPNTGGNYGAVSYFHIGIANDIPIPGHYNPLGAVHSIPADPGIFQPSSGQVILDDPSSSYNQVHQVAVVGNGSQVVAGDFLGDTVTQTGVFVPSTGIWTLDEGKGNLPAVTFGPYGQNAATVALAGDVNADGYTDLIAYTNGYWAVALNQGPGLNFNTSSVPTTLFNAGIPGGIPVVGDFDGDGRLDRAIYDPSTGDWYIQFDGFYNTSNRADEVFHFGGNTGDIPYGFDFNHDGKADFVIYQNGVWYVDDTHSTVDGSANLPLLQQASIIFSYGYANDGDRPLPGYYDTSNSLFVRPGAVGNGAFLHPAGTISAVVPSAAPGYLIRLAPGPYDDGVSLNGAVDLTFVGDTPQGTYVNPGYGVGSGNSFNIQYSVNIYITNINVDSQDSSNPGQRGRGLDILDSTVFAQNLRTDGVMEQGIFSAATGGAVNQIEIRDSVLDYSEHGCGIWAYSDTVGATGCTLLYLFEDNDDYNGLTPSNSTTDIAGQFGAGIVAQANVTATIIGSTGSFNNNQPSGYYGEGFGLNATNNANLYILDSSFDQNHNAGGGIFTGNVTFNIKGSSFSYDGGTPGTPSASGLNGLEIEDQNGTNDSIQSTVFVSDSGYGVFLGNGGSSAVPVLFEGDTFTDNFVGIGLIGYPNPGVTSFGLPGVSYATIIENSFNAVGSNHEEGIFADGGNTTAIIGGPAPEPNVFNNFDTSGLQICIHEATDPNTGTPNIGSESSDLSQNTFNNCISSQEFQA